MRIEERLQSSTEKQQLLLKDVPCGEFFRFRHNAQWHLRLGYHADGTGERIEWFDTQRSQILISPCTAAVDEWAPSIVFVYPRVLKESE